MSFLSLPIRVQNALAGASITTPEELAAKSRLDLFRTKNIGKKAIAAIEAFLAGRNLALRADFTTEAAGPAPEWLLTYERRAKEAGFASDRSIRGSGGMWLCVYSAADKWAGVLNFFGPADFILTARVHNENPLKLIAAANVLADALHAIAPEACVSKQEAA